MLAKMRADMLAGATSAPRKAVSEPKECLVYTVQEAGEMVGLGRNAAYEAARRGDIPTIRIGKLLKVPKAAFHRLLEEAGAVTSA
jgi:excisionase family DNA binding protein